MDAVAGNPDCRSDIAHGDRGRFLAAGSWPACSRFPARPLWPRFLVLDTVADACAGQFAPMVVGD